MITNPTHSRNRTEMKLKCALLVLGTRTWGLIPSLRYDAYHTRPPAITLSYLSVGPPLCQIENPVRHFQIEISQLKIPLSSCEGREQIPALSIWHAGRRFDAACLDSLGKIWKLKRLPGRDDLISIAKPPELRGSASLSPRGTSLRCGMWSPQAKCREWRMGRICGSAATPLLRFGRLEGKGVC